MGEHDLGIDEAALRHALRDALITEEYWFGEGVLTNADLYALEPELSKRTVERHAAIAVEEGRLEKGWTVRNGHRVRAYRLVENG